MNRLKRMQIKLKRVLRVDKRNERGWRNYFFFVLYLI